MSLYIDKLAILAKAETNYSEDAGPTGAANALQVSNVRFTPLAGGEEKRDLIKPYMGHQGVTLTGNYRQIEFDVEMGGAGAAGDVPPYGVLIRGCGFAEQITEDTDVEYSPVSGGFEAASIYYFLDGKKWVMLGSRGKIAITIEPLKKPRFRFTMSGLLGTVSDTALPEAVYAGFVEPPVVSKANTTFSLGGLAAPMSSLTIDGGQQIEPRFLVNYEAIEHVDRQMTGSVVLDQVLQAAKDWEGIALAGTKQELAVLHGTVAGNKVGLSGPAVQIGRMTHGDSQRVANDTLPLIFTPDEGNDELIITVK